MTIRELIEKAEQGGQKIEAGTFESAGAFLNYFDAHYLPILRELEKEWQGDSGATAKRFFASDMMEVFK